MTRKEEAYEYIRGEIVHNQFRPNEVISENQITDKLNMSRTPVREALKQLEADGLIEMRGRENVVAPLTVDAVQEVYELRSLLETFALKKTIHLIPIVKLNELEEAFEQAAAKEDWDEYLQIDTDFHELITHIAGHPRLARSFSVF